MTTPNEELIKQLLALGIPDWKTARWLMTEAADALQSQAERIAELELHRDVQIAMFDGCLSARIQVEAERDTLRAQLAEIEKTEPVAGRVWIGSHWIDGNEMQYVYSEDGDGEPLFTRPMPQDAGRAALAGAEPTGWIRVGDRLPQEEERVLIFTHGHPSISVLYKGEFIMPSAVQPTHWMPLPTPPKD